MYDGLSSFVLLRRRSLRAGKQLGNVRTSLEELSQVKIEMDFEVLLRPVAGIAGHTSVAFKGIPTDWLWLIPEHVSSFHCRYDREALL